MGKIYRFVMVLLLLAFLGIQFIDTPNTNPPVKGEIQIPPEIRIILKKSCYDCHSNETNWPWYGKVAPVSWLIIDDVSSGRKHLNFSEWSKYSSSQRDRKLKDILEQINEDEMPMKSYTFLHPNSSLDFKQKTAIQKWITTNEFWR
jgi:hypothetical protein